MHRIPTDVEFESSRSPAKSESWNNPNLHCAVFLPHDNIASKSHVWWLWEIKRAKRLFTDQRISGLPTRAKGRRFRTTCEQTVDNSPTNPFSSSLNWWSSMHGVATLNNCSIVLFASSQYSHAFLCITFHVIRPMKISFRHQVSPCLLFLVFCHSPDRNPWFEHSSVIFHNILANLTFSLNATQIDMVEEWCWFSQINVFHHCLPCWTNVLLLFSQFHIVHIHRQE